MLADNKLSSMSTWNFELLTNEIEILLEMDFHVETTGFSTAEIDIMLDGYKEPETPDNEFLEPDDIDDEGTIVTRAGDIWCLDTHRLFCGDATKDGSYQKVMLEGELAQMCVTDPPYNVKIDKHVCGNGKIKHAEFIMASGEMNQKEFTEYLGIENKNS